MWQSIKTWFKNTWGKILGTIGTIGILLIAGYFAVIAGVNWIESTLDKKLQNQQQQFVERFDDLENDVNGNIRVLQQKVDSTSEAVQANSQRVPSPNFFQRLFNTQTQQFRDSVLSTIPKVIGNEMDERGLGAGSVGSATLSVKGDTVTFSSQQDKIEGYWGQIVKREQKDDGTYTYQMVLKPINIDLKEVRTRPDPVTGQPRVYISATDERTGEEIEISSTNFNFFDEAQKGFTFDPKISSTLGVRVFGGDQVSPVITGSLDWLNYRGKNTNYSFLSVDANLYSDGDQVKQFITLGLVEVQF